MLLDRRVAVVVPAYNEERQIASVLDTMPAFVDRVYVVDDCSRDETIHRTQQWIDDRGHDGQVQLICHERNGGVGAAINTGYKAAISDQMDVVAVMAGDGQMDPCELESILAPVLADTADYTKGNRLFSGQAWTKTPKTRYLGNAFLSLLTKIASGYWHVADSQTGYTAINRPTLELLDLDAIYPSYGYPNDMLIKLNVLNRRVADVPIHPRYGIGERSKMRIWKVVPSVSLLLLRGFFFRLFHKYVIRDFHPLVFFYALGGLLFSAGFLLGFLETYEKLRYDNVAIASVVLVALLMTSGLQLLLFAMWFDMEYNRELR
jgi:glycosyltransferase involved in cell wall biosynthesis